MKRITIIRNVSRILILLFAMSLVFAGPLPEWLLSIFYGKYLPVEETVLLPSGFQGLLPATDGFIKFDSVVSLRTLRTGFLWGAPAMLFIILAFWKGRFFCRWICPAGTLYSGASNFSMKKKLIDFRLSGYIFWISFFASLAGFPILLFLGPLSGFNRMLVFVRGTCTLASLIPGLVLPVFLLLSFFQPMIWCAYFCPLGYFFSFLHTKNKSFKEKIKSDRREIISGLIVGIISAFALPRLFKAGRKEEKYPVLPPGALPPANYSAQCVRCYACVNVCPSGILSVGFPKDLNVNNWFQPEMNANKGVCEEYCKKCTEVCPSGAIGKLTGKEKSLRQIGTAKVIREKCLAWKYNEYCMVCDEYCPYNAIKNDESKTGIPRPVVNPEKCRGCGFCQYNCPAKHRATGVAIVVHGVAEQKQLKQSEKENIYG